MLSSIFLYMFRLINQSLFFHVKNILTFFMLLEVMRGLKKKRLHVIYRNKPSVSLKMFV